MGILDLLFPKRCVNCGKFGEYLCASCFVYLSFSTSSVCIVCNRQTFTSLTHEKCKGRYVIDGVFTSLIFNKTARRLIYCLKYKPYLADLTSLLAEFFFEGLIQQETFVQTDKTDAFLVPIPLHAKRLRMRGYNQAKYLADALGKHLALPVREVLVRVRFTRSQTTLKRNERRENMRNAFALKHDALLAKNIFLVDDVFTSGATFAEAAYILKRRGVKRVYGLALAHG